MIPAIDERLHPVPPPAYHRAQLKRRPALQLDAVSLVTGLHLLSLCQLAVRLAQRHCPPPLAADAGGRPRRYRDESLLLLALLRTLWRLSYQDLRDWLVAWPALALACGLPADEGGHVLVPSASQQCRRGAQEVRPSASVCSSCSCAWRATGASSAVAILSSTAPQSWPGTGVTRMRRSATPRTTMPVRSCWAIASTRCSAAGPVCRCSSSSPRKPP